MTEEEYFRKNYPDSCYGDRLLSPYWDFFQDGVEFAERQAEERIADIKANCDLAIEGRDIKIKELEKENAELERLNSNQAESLRVTMLEEEKKGKRIEELEKENADLKKRLVSARAEFQRQYKENEELRNNGFTVSAMAEQQLKVAIEKGEQLEKDFRICEQNADTYYDQLTKATEIIKGLYFIIQSRIDYENNTGIADEMWRAEQFLKEIEKWHN